MTRFLTRVRPGGSGAWLGAVVFPLLAVGLVAVAVRLWRGGRSERVAAA